VTNVQDDGTRIFTAENLNKEHSMGFEAMLNFQLARWLNINASTNLYQYRLNGVVADTPVAATSTNTNFRFNGNIRITPTTRFQLQGYFQGPSVTAQGERREFLMTSASLKQDFWKEKLSATLQIRDIFKTATFHFIANGEGFRDEFRFSREPQVVTLTLSYRINNYRNRDRQNDNGEGQSNDDVIMNDQ
jgi:hypothetical protein